MRITNVETHIIAPPFQSFNAEDLRLYHGDVYSYRTVIILHTDNGLEGLGDLCGRGNDRVSELLERLPGTNPCDWLAHPDVPTGVAPAIYDLVGKYNEVPAYKLFGPKVRSRVPLGGWCVSLTPSKMAVEVEKAAEAGYTWLKFHTDHFHDVVAQTAAMQEVAPKGFKLHYDMNADSTANHMTEVIRDLVEFPVAGAIEDPVVPHDHAGYRLLRQKCPIPLYDHHLTLGGREALSGLADGYMMGHVDIRAAVDRAGLFEAANVPYMTQFGGGNIMRAFVVHMAAAHRMATLHHVTVSNLWAEDVVTPVFEVSGGTTRVPEEPGLGVTLDREALARLKEAEPIPIPHALGRLKYQGMPPVYMRPPLRPLLRTTPQHIDGYGPGYNYPVDLDFWYDDGSEEFKTWWDKAVDGPVTGTF